MIYCTPVLIVGFLYVNRHKLDQPDFNLKFGSFYLGVLVRNNFVIWNCMIYYLRRLLFGGVTLLYIDHPII